MHVMARSIVSCCSLVCAAAWSADASPTRPTAGHPLVGKWQWTRAVNHCTEVYEYRADGTGLVLSGAERTDNVYTVSADPDSDGFYRVTIRIEKDYGGKDCADDESDS